VWGVAKSHLQPKPQRTTLVIRNISPTVVFFLFFGFSREDWEECQSNCGHFCRRFLCLRNVRQMVDWSAIYACKKAHSHSPLKKKTPLRGFRAWDRPRLIGCLDGRLRGIASRSLTPPSGPVRSPKYFTAKEISWELKTGSQEAVLLFVLQFLFIGIFGH